MYVLPGVDGVLSIVCHTLVQALWLASSWPPLQHETCVQLHIQNSSIYKFLFISSMPIRTVPLFWKIWPQIILYEGRDDYSPSSAALTWFASFSTSNFSCWFLADKVFSSSRRALLQRILNYQQRTAEHKMRITETILCGENSSYVLPSTYFKMSTCKHFENTCMLHRRYAVNYSRWYTLRKERNFLIKTKRQKIKF